jgi:protein-tyrosine phosphatase
MSNDQPEPVRVLFICLGNICRSPTAEGVFRAHVNAEGWSDRVEVDSAGCAAYHVGEPPDRRAQQAASKRGVDLSTQRARQVTPADFERFDYVLCADRSNLRDLHALQEKHGKGRAHVGLFLSFAEGADRDEIPDPYYGGRDGFEHVLDLCEAASQGLLKTIASSGA